MNWNVSWNTRNWLHSYGGVVRVGKEVLLKRGGCERKAAVDDLPEYAAMSPE